MTTVLRTNNKPYIYLATPHYHEYQWVRDFRYRVAIEITSHYIAAGSHVYSPIVHSHLIAQTQNKLDFDFWREIDCNMIDRMDSILVCKMINWRVSKGIKGEIEHARQREMKIEFHNSWPFEKFCGDKYLTTSQWAFYQKIGIDSIQPIQPVPILPQQP